MTKQPGDGWSGIWASLLYEVHRLLPSPRLHHSQIVYLGHWVCPPWGLWEQREGKAAVHSLGIRPAAPSASFWQDTSRSGLLAT